MLYQGDADILYSTLTSVDATSLQVFIEQVTSDRKVSKAQNQFEITNAGFHVDGKSVPALTVIAVVVVVVVVIVDVVVAVVVIEDVVVVAVVRDTVVGVVIVVNCHLTC